MDLSNHKKFRILPDREIAALPKDRNPLRQMGDAAEMLQLALDSAGAGVWERDLVTNTVRMSPQSLRMLGLPDDHSGAMTQDEWLDLIDVRDVDQVQRWADTPTSLITPHLKEFRIQRPDGEVRWLRVSARILPDQAGCLTRLVGLQFDDTDRKRAEEEVRESEERLRLIQEAALIGTFVTDADYNTVGSRQFYRNLGLPEDGGVLDSETYMGFVHPDDRERVEREALIAGQEADGLEIKYRINRTDTGELRWIFLRIRYERADDGKLIRMIGAHLDITEPKRAEAALRESVALNQSMIEASADCVKLIDLDGQLQFINKQGLAALEIEDGSRLLGRAWAELLPQKERLKVEVALQAARNGQTGRFNAGCPTSTGKPKWWDVVVTPIRDEQGQIKQLLSISRDITEHRENLAQIRWTASHDMLTGLPNRRYFQDRLEQVLARAGAQGLSVGLLQLDVDDFKQINDALGHDAGDALLKTFTQRLQSVTRGNEVVARLGGDEFAIIVPNLTDCRPLSCIIEAIQAHMAEPFVYQGRVFDCRASIGKAIYPQHGETVEDLLKSSDIALYAAKTSGRGNVRRFHPSMRTDMQKRLDMVDRARTALKEDDVPRGGVAGVVPREFRRQCEPVMFRALPRA